MHSVSTVENVLNTFKTIFASVTVPELYQGPDTNNNYGSGSTELFYMSYISVLHVFKYVTYRRHNKRARGGGGVAPSHGL
jgi:hypothetical protein